MSVRDNLDAGKYTNTVPYGIDLVPFDPDHTTVTQAAVHKNTEKVRKQEQRRLYREEEARLNALLQSDLEAEHGVAGNPRAALLWRIAWDRGHSSGYSEVIYCYEEMVELLK